MSSIAQIKKRDGKTVNFDADKIKHAVERAFIDVRRVTDGAKITRLTKEVLLDLEFLFSSRVPNVENVQDVVEKQLMQEGYYDVAKSYILYRYEHAKKRIADGKTSALETPTQLVETQTKAEQLILVKPSDSFKPTVSGTANTTPGDLAPNNDLIKAPPSLVSY